MSLHVPMRGLDSIVLPFLSSGCALASCTMMPPVVAGCELRRIPLPKLFGKSLGWPLEGTFRRGAAARGPLCPSYRLMAVPVSGLLGISKQFLHVLGCIRV